MPFLSYSERLKMKKIEHTTIVKKIWRDVILPREATLLTLRLLLLLDWTLKLVKLYAMRKYMERIRRRNEENAVAAAMQMSKIDTAQEEGVVQQKSEEKCAPPKKFQGETNFRKLPPKN